MTGASSPADGWIGPALVELERYYWSPGGPAEKTKEEMVKLARGNWKAALAIFYGHYAYERAGAPRSWGPLARELLDGIGPDVRIKQVEKLVWQRFTAQVSKPNPTVNPLATTQPKAPATRFIVDLVEDENNIIRWAARRLTSGHAMDTSRTLQGLQGIGPKIAPFFLRDVVTSHDIKEGSLDDRRAILPIDVWVRRGVVVLAGLPPETVRTDKQIQDMALAKADELGIRIATLDAGLWVLGARFARSPARLSEALASQAAFRKTVEGEVRRAEAAAKALRTVLAAATKDS